MTANEIRQSVNGYMRILIMKPPYDKRYPDPAKNYGVGGLTMSFILLRDNNAVQFVVCTPIHRLDVADELLLKASEHYNPFHTLGADVGYHAETPQFAGQPSRKCNLLTTGECYYDGSCLAADEWCDDWLCRGNDYIWQKLEGLWQERFGE